MRKSKRLLALLGVGLTFAMVLTACGGGASGGGGQATSTPTNADEIDGKIDTSKVKKSLTVAVDNPYYLFHEDIWWRRTRATSRKSA